MKVRMVVDVLFMACLCFICRTTVTNDLDYRYVAMFSSHWRLCLVYMFFICRTTMMKYFSLYNE